MHHEPSRPGRRRWLSAAAVGSLTAAACLAGMPAATAASDYLQFSTDGRNYSTALSGPVFRESIVYVPGSTAMAEIWVRNNSADAASLTSAALIVRSDEELNGYLGLRAGDGSGPSSNLPLGGTGTCTDINQSWQLRPGQDILLSFAVDFALEAGNETRNRDADFDLVFLLESEAAGQAARPACAAVGLSPTPSAPSASPQATPSRERSDVAVLAGTGRSTDAVPAFAMGEGSVRQVAGASSLPKSVSKLEAPLASGFASTVEPVIRSLSGTLLITMGVVFAAAVVLRLRENRYE
ncbi:hypothetical protein [Arthrobacter sp. 3Tela_A]|uniref:hypothetical protein n=1 Tax=Arthrobacter sp. 3Tela_A TaxID=3093743 RepID=UPI003BB612E8